MSDVAEYIKSGILEAYVLGLASVVEQAEVETMALMHIEIVEALNSFSSSYQKYAEENSSVQPHPTIKPMLLATFNYMNRLQKGEVVSNPPMLHEGSKVVEFNEWLNREDFRLPDYPTDLHARLIAYTPAATTAIVWIKEMAPDEVHTDEFERFLIVEGTCTITIGEEEHQLKAGDFLEIPLCKTHRVTVTSAIPCKAILQRVAA